MTQVAIRTFGPLTSVIGGHQAQVEFPGTTVGDLLSELTARFGAPMRGYLYPKDGALSDMLFVLVNGKNIEHLGGTSATLKDGDTVSILPITAGG
ncbi:MAG: MoaD family protein [Methanomassiliicoccus sp.]|nr:MoaD family protein [Methanomassiliicoccus sp.]